MEINEAVKEVQDDVPEEATKDAPKETSEDMPKEAKEQPDEQQLDREFEAVKEIRRAIEAQKKVPKDDDEDVFEPDRSKWKKKEEKKPEKIIIKDRSHTKEVHHSPAKESFSERRRETKEYEPRVINP